MEVITSKSNSKIVETKKLQDKKYRDKLGLFLVETKKVVLEALLAGLQLHSIFITEKQYEDFSSICKKNKIDISKINVILVTENVIKELSTVVSPDGIVAVFKKQQTKKEYLGGNFLVLDGLQNPDNMGAIFRTALACDFKQIFVINCVDEYNPKVVRASMGNQFKLNIMHIDYGDIKTMFANASLFALDMQGENLFKQNSFAKNAGFVVGNEGNGLSNQIKTLVKNYIAIPMQNGVESLNASISASVVMYYIFSKSIN